MGEIDYSVSPFLVFIINTYISMEKEKTKKIIEEIHESFYGEVSKLLAQAKIFNNVESNKQHLIDKSKKLKELGFTNTKEIQIAEKEIEKLNKFKEENKEKEKLIETINYFSFHYPHKKFITEESVKKICKKYNLVYGEVFRFMGVVPLENLKEIQDFKIKDVDRCYKKTITYKKSFLQEKIIYVGEGYVKRKRKPRNPKDKSIEIKEAPLEIAAPKKDFDLTGMTINDYKLEEKIEIIDPVVLQPVFYKGKKHYLIVTAWGEEGYDELVYNSKKN